MDEQRQDMPFDTRLDKQDLWTLTTLLRKLPGAKSRDTPGQLYEAYLDALASRRKVFHAGSGSLPVALEPDLFEEKDSGVRVVTPKGAAALVDLYKQGHLPMTRKKPQEVPAEVLAYLESTDSLIAKAAERAAVMEAERLAHEHKVAHPETVKESEFGYRLLDDIFFKHKGPGSHQMDIGGIRVTKTVLQFRSNSGKNHSNEVTFEWKSSTGEGKSEQKRSSYAGNRRNDSDRRWGFHD